MHVADELIGTSGYNMMSPISTYNGIPSQPTLPSAPYTPFYPTNTNQAAPLPDFTIPSYLNFRQSGKYIWIIEGHKTQEVHDVCKIILVEFLQAPKVDHYI